MTTGFFGDIGKIEYEGPESTNPLAFRYYEPDRVVLDRRLEEHLRFAVCYWHTFVWNGGDPFGGQTFDRPWFGATMADANTQGRRRVRAVHDARRAVLLLPRRRRAPRGRDVRREHEEPPAPPSTTSSASKRKPA